MAFDSLLLHHATAVALRATAFISSRRPLILVSPMPVIAGVAPTVASSAPAACSVNEYAEPLTLASLHEYFRAIPSSRSAAGLTAGSWILVETGRVHG